MDLSEINLLRKYVSDECTKEELLQVHEALKRGVSDEVWQKVMDEMIERTDFTALNTTHRDKLYLSIVDRIGSDTAKRNRFLLPVPQWLLRTAAAILVLLASSLAIYFFNYRPTDIEQMSGLQHQHLRTEDGSEIWMNRKSKLIYPNEFGTDQRLVKLEGEAFFDVARESDRPFIIHTQDIRIQVLGTSFNVKSYQDENEIVISLATGRIEVDVFGEKQILTPGEQLHYSKTTKSFQRVLIDTKEANAWKDGWMVFNRASLHDVIRTAERQFGVHVVMTKDVPTEEKITLKVKQRSVENLFQVLSYSTGLEYQMKGDSVILESKRHQ